MLSTKTKSNVISQWKWASAIIIPKCLRFKDKVNTSIKFDLFDLIKCLIQIIFDFIFGYFNKIFFIIFNFVNTCFVLNSLDNSVRSNLYFIFMERSVCRLLLN